MRRTVTASVLAICLIGLAAIVYWKKPSFHPRPIPVTKVSRVTGKLKWFNDAKGYSFIAQEDGTDVFVHHSDIQPDGFKSLQVGDDLEFEVVQGPKGQQARNVVKVPKPSH